MNCKWISARLQAVNFHVCRLTAGGRRATKAVSDLLTAQWRHAATESESRRQRGRPVNIIASDPIVRDRCDVIDGHVKPLKSRRLVAMTAANSIVSRLATWQPGTPGDADRDCDDIVACPALTRRTAECPLFFTQEPIRRVAFRTDFVTTQI